MQGIRSVGANFFYQKFEIFAVFLHVYLQFYYVSVAVTLFRVLSTWYGACTWSASFLRCSRSPTAITKFGIKGVTATYYSSDCEKSLYYRTSRDQPYKLLYKLMSSALFHKI